VCKKRNMIRMLMESIDFLGLWIELGSGLIYLVMSTLFITHVLYDDFINGFHVYELIILSLLADAGMVTLANLTHIWSKGVIHIY
jgi:hypothetical protein